MVGIGAALALQGRGHAVTVIDRRDPGQETSFGNAGVIQIEAMQPYPMPRDLATLLRYGLGMTNDVVWRWQDLPSFAPQVLSYFNASAAKPFAKITAQYSQLIARVHDDHAPLIQASGAGNMIRKTGLAEIYRSAKAMDKAARSAEDMVARFGLNMRLTDGPDLAREDPGMSADIAGAVVWQDSWSCEAPGDLVNSYANLFCNRGGRILHGDANSLRQSKSGWQVDSKDGAAQGQHVVVALGPWSSQFLRPYGYRIPMLLKRGYHAHVDSSASLSRPYLDAEHGYVMSPMRDGLRLTTGAELCRMDRPQSRRQLDHTLLKSAELVAHDGKTKGEIWHGHRPFLPGMLPKVAAAANHQGMWFNFGHGHHGFTLGPTTGELLADMIGNPG